MKSNFSHFGLKNRSIDHLFYVVRRGKCLCFLGGELRYFKVSTL